MLSRYAKHLITCSYVFLLLCIGACKKESNHTAPLVAPTQLIYTPDTIIILKGIADTSVTPSIDWQGHKGTFSFAGAVPQGITIDNNSGKISWTSSLPIGTYLLPVVASNGPSTADTAYYTLTVSGKIITIAGSTQGFSGDGGAAINAQLYTPFDVTTDPQGNIYIADAGNSRIRKIDANGVITTFAGNGTYGFAGDGGPATQARLSSTSGIATDGQGNLYITDYGNNRIRKVDANGIITTVAGSDDYTVANLGDEGLATKAWLHLLGGKVALDAQGSLYIADYGNDVLRKVTTDGIIHSITSKGPWALIPDGAEASKTAIPGPCGVYWDAASSNLYIASNLGSVIYRLNSGSIYGVAGNIGGWGVEGNKGDGGPATKATLFRPTNVVADKDGNLFIADYANNKIRKVDTQGIISTVAGNGKSSGPLGDDGPAAAAQLSMPYGLAVDANGDLYIADVYNNRIRKVILH